MPESSTSDSFKIKLILIGAQYGGLNFLNSFLDGLGKTVPSDIQITVIDAKDHFQHYMATPRATVDVDTWKHRILVPYDNMFGKRATTALPNQLQFIQGKVTSIKDHSLELVRPDNSTLTLDFHYLVLATGIRYTAPFALKSTSIQASESELCGIAGQVKSAKSVLVIGGGPVGLEIAGELSAAYPDKKITLVHGHAQLLHTHEGVHPKLGEKFLQLLKRRGVEVVLDDRIKIPENFDPSQPKTLISEKGKEFVSDYQFVCTGAHLNTEYLASFDDGKVLTSKKEVKVNASFQMEGHEHIFAVGVINNIPCWKVGYLSNQQGEHLGKHMAKTLSASLKAGTWSPTLKLTVQPWPIPGLKAMILVAGKDAGVMQMGRLTFGNFLAKTLKSRDIFYQRNFEVLNKKVHP